MTKSVQVPSGKFVMGADKSEGGHPLDKEYPKKELSVKSFSIDETTVTNEEFKEFIDVTGYKTQAEIMGGSFVFYLLLDESKQSKYVDVPKTKWWKYVEGACWKCPEGVGSDVKNRLDHPVVHVTRNDAIAYCNWAKKRLPTEVEWEYAARGGVTTKYPWGEELLYEEKHRANIWQGDFPVENTLEDGFLGTSPVKSFEPNELGLYDVIGNVWEWCLNPGGIRLETFSEKDSNVFYEEYWDESDNWFAIRGGSFLCHDSYCNRYRLGARNQNAGDASSSNLGFRCVSL